MKDFLWSCVKTGGLFIFFLLKFKAIITQQYKRRQSRKDS